MEKELIQTICESIKLDTRLGLSSFGPRAGVGRTTISDWKHGKYSPRLNNFCKVVDRLGYKLVLVKK